MTKEERRVLMDRQYDLSLHPYTCPGSDKCPTRILFPSETQWVCACGEYKQGYGETELRIVRGERV